MKLRLFLISLFTAIAVHAADNVPVFNAVLTMAGENRFVLVGTDGKTSGWLKIGEAFAGYTLKTFDAKSSTLEVQQDGKTVKLTLAGGAGTKDAPAPTAATLADAQSVLSKMHFEEMLERSFAQQKKSMASVVDQMAGQLRVPGANREEFVAFQQKLMDEMLSTLDPAQMKNDMAQIYSEVFSKQEMDAMAAFYSTPLGESSNAKQPEVQEKLTALITPRMMQALPKIRQMAQQFATEQKAKQAAAAAAGGGAPAPVKQ